MSTPREIEKIKAVMRDMYELRLPITGSYLIFDAELPRRLGRGKLLTDDVLDYESLRFQYSFRPGNVPEKPLHGIRMRSKCYEIWFGDDNHDLFTVRLDRLGEMAIIDYKVGKEDDKRKLDMGIPENSNAALGYAIAVKQNADRAMMILRKHGYQVVEAV
jgi:hypothetical protein